MPNTSAATCTYAAPLAACLRLSPFTRRSGGTGRLSKAQRNQRKKRSGDLEAEGFVLETLEKLNAQRAQRFQEGFELHRGYSRASSGTPGKNKQSPGTLGQPVHHPALTKQTYCTKIVPGQESCQPVCA